MNDEIDNNHETDNNMFNRTIIVGPSFCGKTHLLLNKLQLIHLDNPKKQIKITTRSPEQYSNFELGDTGLQAELLRCVSVEEDLEDRTIQGFQNCCVVFNDMLDSNQKLIDPFSLEEDMMISMFIIYHSHISNCLKEQLETIRI